jgi:phospholipid-binding lipoprotein MlaA
MRRAASVALAVLLPILGGCATVPSDPAARAVFRANNDPLEPLNRRIFAFNQGVDQVLLKPISKAYVALLPQLGRDAVRNFLENLNEPIVFANDALQGRFRPAGTTACRFAINTTAGLAGLIDVAGRHGFGQQTGDFGQTLHVWGIPEGPYLLLPVVGPSSPRDGIGSGVDIYLSPWRYVAINNNYPTGLTIAEMGLAGIDERSRNLDSLDELRRESVDYYAAFRSLYRQHRAAELAEPAGPAADFYSDPGSP